MSEARSSIFDGHCLPLYVVSDGSGIVRIPIPLRPLGYIHTHDSPRVTSFRSLAVRIAMHRHDVAPSATDWCINESKWMLQFAIGRKFAEWGEPWMTKFIGLCDNPMWNALRSFGLNSWNLFNLCNRVASRKWSRNKQINDETCRNNSQQWRRNATSKIVDEAYK